jgi:hypothetical protein
MEQQPAIWADFQFEFRQIIFRRALDYASFIGKLRAVAGAGKTDRTFFYHAAQMGANQAEGLESIWSVVDGSWDIKPEQSSAFREVCCETEVEIRLFPRSRRMTEIPDQSSQPQYPG